MLFARYIRQIIFKALLILKPDIGYSVNSNVLHGSCFTFTHYMHILGVFVRYCNAYILNITATILIITHRVLAIMPNL